MGKERVGVSPRRRSTSFSVSRVSVVHLKCRCSRKWGLRIVYVKGNDEDEDGAGVASLRTFIEDDTES